ncbi:MAG: hypothetical protein ACYCW6_05585 [Candidatus Xenobia bacterium]
MVAAQVLEQMAAAVEAEPAVLLVAPDRAAAWPLLTQLAKQAGATPTRIWCDAEMNSQLLGRWNYVPTREPPVVYERGWLTDAVAEGRWILLKDLDTAPEHLRPNLASLFGEPRGVTAMNAEEQSYFVPLAPGGKVLALAGAPIEWLPTCRVVYADP